MDNYKIETWQTYRSKFPILKNANVFAFLTGRGYKNILTLDLDQYLNEKDNSPFKVVKNVCEKIKNQKDPNKYTHFVYYIAIRDLVKVLEIYAK